MLPSSTISVCVSQNKYIKTKQEGRVALVPMVLEVLLLFGVHTWKQKQMSYR